MHNFNSPHIYTALFYLWACSTAAQTIFTLTYQMAATEPCYPKGVIEIVHTLNERSSHGEEVSPALSLSFCTPQTQRACLLWEQCALPFLSNRSTLLSSCAWTKGYLQGAKAKRNFMQQIKDISVALKCSSSKISKVGCKQRKLLKEFFNNLI